MHNYLFVSMHNLFNQPLFLDEQSINNLAAEIYSENLTSFLTPIWKEGPEFLRRAQSFYLFPSDSQILTLESKRRQTHIL